MNLSSRITLVFLAFLAGCAGPSASPFRGLSSERARALAAQMSEARQRELDADLRSAFAIHPPENVLILSGGDQDGAFGSGILRGWRAAPGGRPTFDVVTGVSTGALMATFAFLGEERDDAVLAQIYTHVRAGDLYRIIAPGSFDAVLDTQPLKGLLARSMPEQPRDIWDITGHSAR
jgi:predicted acylesterase/phospholipase RssA